LPHCIGRLAVRLFSVPLPVSTNALDRAREAGRSACPVLVGRLGRNAGCHLVLDITFPPFRMIAPLAKFIAMILLLSCSRQRRRLAGDLKKMTK
jgi:hypothetical protein